MLRRLQDIGINLLESQMLILLSYIKVYQTRTKLSSCTTVQHMLSILFVLALREAMNGCPPNLAVRLTYYS